MARVKVAIFGIGQVGVLAARQLIDENFDIVAAYSRDHHLGEDLGSVAGGAALGLLIEAADNFDPAKIIADVALFFTTGSPYDLLDAPKKCLEAGINVVTIAEGATYPWTFDSQLSAEIDAAGKRGGASLAATGITDTYMVHLPAILASTVPGVTGVIVTTVGDFGRLGPAAIGGMPLGLSTEDFQNMMQTPPPEDSKPQASISGQCLEAMAALMGQTAGRITTSLDLILAEKDIYIPTIYRTIKKGTISGLLETVEMKTGQGITLKIILSAEIFADNKPEIQKITVEGSGPPLQMEVGPTPGVEVTAAIAINRIADIIAAAPGLQTIDRLPAPFFRSMNV